LGGGVGTREKKCSERFGGGGPMYVLTKRNSKRVTV